jgi:hypothetical protein
MNGRAFGRLVVPDARDATFPMGAVLMTTPTITVKTRVWRTGPILDQGDTSQCVAYSWKQYLQCSPLRQGYFLKPDFIYELAQQRDDFQGENYDGTSVRAGAKVLQRLGFIENFRWATSVADIKNWLLGRGPVVFGTDWLECMSNPGKGGVLDFATPGDSQGGHAYLCIGWNEKKGLFRFVNSWGPDWGDKGYFWIRPQDVEALIKGSSGEACAAVERRV